MVDDMFAKQWLVCVEGGNRKCAAGFGYVIVFVLQFFQLKTKLPRAFMLFY